jgi:hypothetical protein
MLVAADFAFEPIHEEEAIDQESEIKRQISVYLPGSRKPKRGYGWFCKGWDSTQRTQRSRRFTKAQVAEKRVRDGARQAAAFVEGVG